MNFFLTFFDKIENRPAYKFFLNIFLSKNTQYYSIKQLNYIHIFYNVKNILQIKFFKFNYIYYTSFISYLIYLNIFLQIMLVLL